MKLPRTTIVLILLALGLGGFVYFYEIRGKTQREQVKTQQQQIFSFKEDDIQSLTVTTKDFTLNLKRNTGTQDSQWLLISPTTEPANDAIVSYLTDLLVASQSDRTLSIPTSQKAEFGLAPPLATININLKNQKTHLLILGKPDFNRRFLYAQTDLNTQENGNTNILLVSTNFENAVNRELSEWKKSQDTSEHQGNPENETNQDEKPKNKK
ncbi:DUF4340 domain-containing protein [Umezakia ovalisporum]|jgi:hypothetical protein|uniref:DUF4340 domain-containing protein n=1 Tax=Umezakia ovalisporum FSS-43 TaxID=2740520 RepID=A0ABT6K5B6_9CYAN|nr:DUF4340 domain-containing protein [Umezakia ovalisporum]MBI1242710.1 DUF4340 domain-containing protein [Nostoc sp. RI_552]MDH6057512.1 DUF4340 domain-containing protein [Umezakia ovalisporum FSS-43]MDH6066549.1 DUF4340 domain-containing protein [Umezakia ovalisporum APH033B]MDH6070979.1 DUF4340 domain-containing protein [Umezakia ovalisporum CobakiLakeA]MDH6073438.1 DUF4340 domain-containing protein [Umezakia ovalisporum CS-1034]